MKRTLKFIALLVIALCSGTLALTLVRAERPESAIIKHAVSAPSDSAPAAIGQEGKAYRQDVAKVLKRHDSLVLDPQHVAEQVRQTGRLSIPTAAGTFDLRLAPHDMRAANYRAEVSLDDGEVRSIEQGPVRTYKGTVAGIEGAQARFTIDENMVEGLIITPSDLYFVEPANRYSGLASTTDYIAYKASDLVRTSFGECGTMAEKVGSEAARVEAQVSMAHSPVVEELFSPPRMVDLATEADFEYFTNFGSAAAANNEIISIMNQVEGIYNTQFGLQFTIVFQNVWGVAGDPYDSTAASTALNEFANQWDLNRQGVARDLAHMWTGKDFDGSTIGIAFRIPGIECPLGSGGYGMSQRLPESPDKFLVAAHEIGHNFGAEHSNGQAGCDNTIMGTTLGSSTMSTFCPFSVSQIEGRANSVVACLPQTLTPNCSYSISPSSQSFGVNGGSGSISVTTVGTNCAWAASSSVGWVTVTSGSSGTNNGTVMFAVGSNFGFARSAIIGIANQSFTVTQAGSGNCPIVPIANGPTINATLSPADCDSPRRVDSRADQYSFAGAAGDQIRIEMTATGSSTVDTYLYLIGPSGLVVTENDDIDTEGGNLNSRIPVSGFFTLPASGTYLIEATSFNVDEVGAYSLRLTSNAPPPTPTPTPTPTPVFNISGRVSEVSISGPGVSGVQINISVPPGTPAQAAVITNSNGDFQFTGLPAGGPYNLTPVDARFTFSPGFQGIQNLNGHVTNANFVAIRRTIDLNGRVLENGSGLAGVTVWLLHQATQQTRSVVTGGAGTYQFTGALLNDGYEVIPLKDGMRFNPTSLIFTATQPNLGDITATQGNPIDGSQFFVTKHYEDFLGRQPDAGGLQFWTDNIDAFCGPFAQCRQDKRIDTSAAFFLSIEFQETGYLVYRMYKTAYEETDGQAIIGGVSTPIRVPIVRRQDFIPDTQRIGQGVVVGTPGWPQRLENNKVAYAEEFVTSARFLTDYPTNMPTTVFVGRLNSNAGGVFSNEQVEAMIAELNAGGNSTAARAIILRRIAEHPALVAAEFNKAFVLMQYFGYLQRNPNDGSDTDHSGYKFWLDKLNLFNGDFRQSQMVAAFILSIEYRNRFGP